MFFQLNLPIKSLPFFRLVIALLAGILIQWYSNISLRNLILITFLTVLLVIVFNSLSSAKKFVHGWVGGIFILLLFACAGALITWQQNIHNDIKWYGNNYKTGDVVLLTIQEPLVQKANSYKALATVNAVYKVSGRASSTGNILLYFKKDSLKPALQYGSMIVLHKPLQPIQNNGNPATLDYNRYCLFQNITGQAFLSADDYRILSSTNINIGQRILFTVRDRTLNILKQYIHSPAELGIAEALLIGYRNDLDKDIVQAYSNTGAVHIIAISGLHIALIYAALLKLFSIFRSSITRKWLEPVVILLVIWLFTLVAGAAPSVLRAAVMFTFILLGKFIGKNGNVYNTLAASAFVLLIINPFYLWDVGFQLSYAAVFSIIVFFRPVNNLLYFKNRTLRWMWQLCAVSLSAQVFTVPLVVYHFHQFPVLFLVSNLLVVPLSAVILFAELFLFAVSWLPVLASVAGIFTETLTRCMNDFIQHINKISFSVWDGLYISIVQLLLLFAVIAFASFWMFSKKAGPLITSLSCALVFFCLRDIDLLQHKTQRKLIVYNVPKQTAVDIISGNCYRFAGDSIVVANTVLRNFNLKPARIKNRISNSESIKLPDITGSILNISSFKILILGNSSFIAKPAKKLKLDVLILSHNVNQAPADLNDLFDCRYIIADSSIPVWKSAKWKKEFEQLHLRFYSVAHNGAFTLKF